MWISRIELINFKSYMHQKFEFPKPHAGKNLVLIGGMNGYGKTTLLEAIYLCFYGAEATSHLARAGLNNDAYGKFLKKALHGKALRLGRSNMMEVSTEFYSDDYMGYELSRRWYFDPQGGFLEEEVKLYKLKGNNGRDPLSKDELLEILDDYAVPAHLAPFFFFDGEEVKKLADQDRKEWIKQGMESLLGVVLLRDLRVRLEQYQNNRNPSGKPSMDEEKLAVLHKTLIGKENELKALKAERQLLWTDKESSENNRNSLHQRLSTIGAGGGELKQVENLIRDEGEKKEALRKTNDALERLLTEKLPFHLVNASLMTNLKNQLQQEATLLEWENKKQSVAPQKERFVSSFFATDFFNGPFVDHTVKNKLRESIDIAWQGLFNPQPEGCAKELIHNYLEPRQRQKLDEQFVKIQVTEREIKKLLEDQALLDKEIEALIKDRIRLEALHDDGTLHQLQQELKEIEDKLGNLREKLGDKNRHITTLESEVHDKRSTYEREHDIFLKATPIKSNLRKAERVIDLIKELLPELFALKTKALSDSVTEIFIKLAHKKQIARIEIDEKGMSRLLSGEGKEIGLDRSAGENQIFATALIAGLAKTSGFNIPLVVDTPLGRLDSEHRKRILEYWLSDPDRQIILLSQDEEIDSDVYTRICSHVAKTYLLKHEQLGEGVGKTVALENKYFEVAA
ncbi:DNA sulfur modification protein DndD [Methylotuvimicrobium sp. KM2]|uniref:DNA sulfur modification protein DndD n=1 Tax=Methylotuvimicrobium sp. KM2 TaxID=3133976 RepID=UPI003100D235